MAGDAEVLAREAAADEIDGREVVRADGLHVVVLRGVREFRGEQFATGRLALDVPRAAHPSAFESEVEAANPGKERAERQSPGGTTSQ